MKWSVLYLVLIFSVYVKALTKTGDVNRKAGHGANRKAVRKPEPKKSNKPQHVPDSTPRYSKTEADNHPGKASTWGKGIYKTFDDHIFTFKSACNFTFCRHCVESGRQFNIEMNRNKEGRIDQIAIVIDGNEISVKGGRIVVNSKYVQVPFDNKMIRLKKYGGYTKLESRRGFLTLMWNGDDKLLLTLHKSYDTCGLCGDINASIGTDITQLITDSKIPDTTCPEPVIEQGLYCDEGRMYCSKIISKHFRSCHNVGNLYKEYERVCTEEYCRTMNRVDACPTFSELAQECAIKGSGPYEKWRSDPDVLCATPTCPESEIYKDCGPSNQATCSFMSPFQEAGCVSGCVCPEGYVHDDIEGSGKCIAKANCACKFNGKVYKPGEVRKGTCNSQCTCQDAKWSCTESLCPGKCAVEGPFITTFDGNSYRYPGDCHYVAIQDKDWSLSVELRPCFNGPAETCLKSVTLTLGLSVSADRYVFHNNGSFYNDKIRHLDYYASDTIIIFKHSSSYIGAELYFGLKLQIQIAPIMQLYASLPAKSFTNTAGLCGSFNNNAEDDFMSSQHILEVNSEAFARSWEMMTCPKVRYPSCASIEKERFAKENCAVLIDPNGVFASGHSTVDHRSYYQKCLSSTCMCEKVKDCLCTALGNYVKACAKHGIYITGWRQGICEQDCEAGRVFQYNASACNTSCRSFSERDMSCEVQDTVVDGCVCPEGRYSNNKGICVEQEQCNCYMDNEILKARQIIKLDNYTCVCRKGQVLCHNPSDFTPVVCPGGAEFVTCSDPKAKRRVDKTCSALNMPSLSMDLPCRRGCFCPIGTVRNSQGHCIPPSLCPCSYSGRKYEQGSVIKVECNVCTCVQGFWKCSENRCQSSCHIYGDGQVHTFDRKWYSYDGLCQYVLAEDYCGKEKGSFRILTESVPCCDDGITCSRKITVVSENGNLVLEDGKFMFVKNAGSTPCETDNQLYTVHTVGLYLIIKYIHGITLIWDKNTRISVILEPNWSREICGLCGNHNGNLQDEFTTRQGSLAVGPVEFGNSWKTNPTCSDTVTESFPCDTNAYCKDWALRKCEIITDYRFRSCHKRVDPTPYHKACVEEACACTMEGNFLGFCTAVSMYAEACAAAGVCIQWRTPELCPVFCDYYNAPGECSWHYEPCGTLTSKTCKDHLIGRILPTVLEGCYAKCPDNAPYLDENTMKCVRLSDCTCFHNEVILAGQIIYDNCGRICVCKAGELVCSDFPGIPRIGVVPRLKTTAVTTSRGLSSDILQTGRKGLDGEGGASSSWQTESVTEGTKGSTAGWSAGVTEIAVVGSSSIGYTEQRAEGPLRTITSITSSINSWTTEGAGVGSLTGTVGRSIPEEIEYARQHTESSQGTIASLTGSSGATRRTESGEESWPLSTTKNYVTGVAMGGSSSVWTTGIEALTKSIGRHITEHTEGIPEDLATPTVSTTEKRAEECPTVPESSSCRFKNKYHKIGETFNDPDNPCLKYTCAAEGFTTEVEECPGQNWCSNESRIYHQNKCCYDCVNVCQPTPMRIQVNANGCKRSIMMPRCTGTCKKVTWFDDVKREVVDKCFCCKTKEHVFKNVTILCPGRKSELYKYKHSVSCSCEACGVP